MLGVRADIRWQLLLAGFVLFAVADTQYLLQSAEGTYQAGTWLDALWPTALATIVVAAWQRVPAPTSRHVEGWRPLLLPLSFMAASLALLALDHARRLSAIGAALAVATLAVAIARMALSYRESSRFAAENRRLALTDELTGLANRRMLIEHLNVLARRRMPFGMVLIDLNRFKEINDSLGHAAGDELLREVARGFARRVRPSDLLARVGGDEFALACAAIADRPGAARTPAEQARARAEELLAALATPIELDGVTVHVDATAGVATFPDDAGEAGLLLRRADVAMYEAKRTDLPVAVYRADHDVHTRERLETIEALRLGIERGELSCHFQPQVELATGRVRAFEALARWNHPSRGLLAPATFIPLAEQAGLMRPLTLAVLEAALHESRRLRRQGYPSRVAVNLSATNLLDDDLPALVLQLLDDTGALAEALILEITEEMLVADGERAGNVIARLRARGIAVALDDYGTGYSSLAYLRDLPVDELKLDRTFVTGLEHDRRKAAIVRSTITMAHDLGLTVVAEGIETAAAATTLQRYGCDTGQGFQLSAPLPADRLEAWLDGRKALVRCVPLVPAPRLPDAGAAVTDWQRANA